MRIESVATVEILQEAQELQIKQHSDAQTQMETAIALGVQAMKNQVKARAARIEEVRASIEAGTYQQDSLAIAQKMLEIEPEERN
jgi:anti-sigma28 factor (negative regulator of flagellin synthesis)